jgi:hypothetical protein
VAQFHHLARRPASRARGRPQETTSERTKAP